MGCSSGLIDCCVPGLLRSCLSGIATCCGDSRCFDVLGKGCDSFQDGPSLQVNSSCFLNKGVVRMGGTCSGHDDDATGGEGSVSGKSSLHFPISNDD